MADLPRFDLGQAGVVLTSTPVHGDPGQLTKGQNIEFRRVSGLGGISSRGPLQPFTKSIMKKVDGVTPGPVLAAVEVPLPSPVDAGTIPAIFLFTTTGWLYSTDGSTFTPVSLSLPPDAGVVGVSDGAGNTYYSSNGTIVKVKPDGTQTNVVTGLNNVQALHFFAGKLYIATAVPGPPPFIITAWDGSTPSTPTLQGAVIVYDPNLGSHAQLGETFGAGAGQINGWVTPSTGGLGLVPVALTDDGTNLYVGAAAYFPTQSNGALPAVGMWGAYVAHLNPATESSWALHIDTTGFYLGNDYAIPGESEAPVWFGRAFATQYFGTYSSGLATAIAPPNVFDFAGDTFNDGNPPSGGSGTFGPFIVFNGSLFIAKNFLNADGSPNQVKVYRLDSPGTVSTITLDKDLLGTFAGNVQAGVPWVFGTTLYWPLIGTVGHTSQGYIVKRTTGGVWSLGETGLSLSGGGFETTVPV